jgi:hypothetical protein
MAAQLIIFSGLPGTALFIEAADFLEQNCPKVLDHLNVH